MTMRKAERIIRKNKQKLSEQYMKIDTSVNGKNWNHKEIEVDFNYVILDDDSDMLLEQAEHFVKTDTYLSLSEDDIERAINILNQ